MIDIEALEAPFDIEEIKQRPLVTKKDKSAALPANYIDARTVAKRLDEVVGPMLWQRDHKEIKGVVYAGIGIYSEEINQWIWKWDSGVESNMEKEKGESSDSFKRAAVNWGIGRFLYELPEMWVDGKASKAGKFYFDNASIKAYRKQLSNYLTGGDFNAQEAQQGYAKPTGRDNYYTASESQYNYIERLVNKLGEVLSDEEQSKYLNAAKEFTEKPYTSVSGEKISSKKRASDMIDHLNKLDEEAKGDKGVVDEDGDTMPDWAKDEQDVDASHPHHDRLGDSN